MKKISTFLLTGVLIGIFNTAQAQDVWVLLHKDSHYLIARSKGNDFHEMLSLGGSQIAYGESSHTFGVISYDAVRATFVVDLLDKASGTLTRSAPLDGHVMGLLSGPSNDVVLTDDALFYLTVRFEDISKAQSNPEASLFDLNRLDLASGRVRKIPLPRDCANPRMIAYAGAPVVYAWNGYGVWQFDAIAWQLVQLVSTEDVVEILQDEKEGKLNGRVKHGAWADYAFVADAGAFRLSKLGDLHHVLDADLKPISALPSIHLGSAADLKVFSATFEARPVVGVLRKREDSWTVAFLDPVSFETKWETSLGEGAMPNTVFPTADGQLFYVDQYNGSINKASKRGTSAAWQLDEVEKLGFFEIRILRVTIGE
jgi:hypothetical protein